MKTLRILSAVALLLFALGCTAAERRAMLTDTGAYVNVPARDVDPLVDSDGDGNPANDVDNSGEILGGLVAYFMKNPTPIGAGIAGSGLLVYLATRYFKRRAAKVPPKEEEDEDDDGTP